MNFMYRMAEISGYINLITSIDNNIMRNFKIKNFNNTFELDF